MALALVLIIEGMFPFVSPRRYRKLMSEILQFDDSHIRKIGFMIMIIGLVLLFLIPR
ncbi:MAG: DUF2065 domain-containing protein [Gammaproteobacteria bacterium]|nr:DUF2065 domain-containing protein [Gammaproteobacteria bacterium]|tara:strand:- start:77 stop:247 length:171 start_codon:yes stop_codon:yes gene_type:complete